MKLFYLLLLMIFVVACNSNAPEENANTDATEEVKSTHDLLQERIVYLEEKLISNSEDITVDNKLVFAKEVLRLYLDFEQTYPEDSLSPGYLFKASDLALQFKQFDKALACYDTLEVKYPAYENMDMVYLLKAEIKGEQYKDIDEAKKYYQMVLDSFPNSPYQQAAKDRLSNLKVLLMSDEEKIEYFESLNQ